MFLCLLKETEFRWVAGRDHQQVAFWKWMLHFQDTGISWRSIAYHSFWEWDTKWCNQPLVNTSKWKCAPRVWSKYQPKTKQTPFLDSGCIHLQVSRARAGLRPRVHGSWSGNMPPPGGHCHPGKTSTTSKLIPDQCFFSKLFHAWTPSCWQDHVFVLTTRVCRCFVLRWMPSLHVCWSNPSESYGVLMNCGLKHEDSQWLFSGYFGTEWRRVYHLGKLDWLPYVVPKDPKRWLSLTNLPQKTG